MRRWKKIVLGFLLTSSLLAVAVVGWAWRRKVAEQRAQASFDSLLLPSQSQRVMPLVDTLEAAARDRLFLHSDIAPLWLLNAENPVQNGLLGPHHQRLEVVFQRAWQDERQPGRFHLRGLLRVARVITPVQGTVWLRQVREHHDLGYQHKGLRAYTAVGPFTFHTTQGVLHGTAALDWQINSQGQLNLFDTQVSPHPSRGFAFEGATSKARSNSRYSGPPT
ncbi:hypothetical protein [Hymenobacter cellulosilyticus]|uniref:Uncharacterized protein n=1 Tax=Hymenobacter cellulosilyticus TaxID=2932248 RepID=A0A8T9Q6X9_9BACT|nr:hypothetical protein [Hymenobacter cellulosilyticus]UOQ71239.1 hypothetical protein MUN79_21695 [Hymenobacter cellulosilyticus]